MRLIRCNRLLKKRQAGMSLLLGEDESTEILTPKLMRVRMKLLRSEIKELIVNLEEMTVDEFNKYIGIGPPGNYPELYEAGQASLVSHLKSIHIGLTARGTKIGRASWRERGREQVSEV